MQTIEALRSQIDSTEDLFSIVKTMKSIAVVNINHYEKAVRSLADYNHTVELGLQILMKDEKKDIENVKEPFSENTAAVVIGSDQGMVGQFNHRIVNYAAEKMQDLELPDEKLTVLAVGLRGAALLREKGIEFDDILSVPGSVKGITPLVQEILLYIEEWREKKEINRILLFYNAYEKGTAYHPAMIQVLPVDFSWLDSLQKRNWLSKRLPVYFSDWQELFASIIRELFFVSIFRSVSESLASENASRLSAMQAAENNIKDRLSNLRQKYQQTRQIAITEELLDVVAGYETLMN